MAETTGRFPIDLNYLRDGRVRMLLAHKPDLTALPASPVDVVDPLSPYAAKTHWLNVGATNGALSHARGRTLSDWRVQQRDAAVFRSVTDSTMQIGAPAVQLSPTLLAILEHSPGVETIAAATGHAAYSIVPVGNITDLEEFAIAFLGFYKRAQGIIREGASDTKGRGRMFGYVGYRATLAGDTVTVTYDAGNMAAADLTFDLYPDPAAVEDKEFGYHFEEDQGDGDVTIATS